MDGKYTTVTSGRTSGKSMTAIVNHLYQKYADIPVWVTVLHGRFAEKAEILGDEIEQKLIVARMETMRISPVLGVHTGPGIVGAALVPMEWMDDLVR
jgi:fatty acid-binding protein DegV